MLSSSTARPATTSAQAASPTTASGARADREPKPKARPRRRKASAPARAIPPQAAAPAPSGARGPRCGRRSARAARRAARRARRGGRARRRRARGRASRASGGGRRRTPTPSAPSAATRTPADGQPGGARVHAAYPRQRRPSSSAATSFECIAAIRSASGSMPASISSAARSGSIRPTTFSESSSTSRRRQRPQRLEEARRVVDGEADPLVVAARAEAGDRLDDADVGGRVAVGGAG